MKTEKLLFKLLLIPVLLLITACCEDPDPVPPGPPQTGIYLGIVGFNETLFEKGLGLLTDGNRGDYNSFISDLQSADGTILYHAVNKSIEKLADANLPDDIVDVSVITFTDGLDLGSYILNDDYNSGTEYLSGINGRIKNDRVKDLSISAYSIGIKGNDVTDDQQFSENISSLASEETNAFEVEDMATVEAIFREIASSLTNISNSQSLDLTLPAPNPGTKIRFTFDNVGNDAANSSLYIEGIFTSQSGSYSLTNVVYNGISSISGSTVNGVASGIKFTFTFNDIEKANGKALTFGSIKQWSYVTSNNSWQINSEFNPIDDTHTNIEKSSAAIILVLDCSSSLAGTGLYKMQDAAKSFIQVLLEEESDVNNNDDITYSQVRFEKLNTNDPTQMAIFDASNNQIASSQFAQASGLSSYTNIDPGAHIPAFYRTNAAEAGWYYCLTASPNTYNFQPGYKYTVRCNGDGVQYYNFDIINNGAIGN